MVRYLLVTVVGGRGWQLADRSNRISTERTGSYRVYLHFRKREKKHTIECKNLIFLRPKVPLTAKLTPTHRERSESCVTSQESSLRSIWSTRLFCLFLFFVSVVLVGLVLVVLVGSRTINNYISISRYILYTNVQSQCTSGKIPFKNPQYYKNVIQGLK